MAEPLAYFITWTTHGTRVHGDARGSVDFNHRTFGTPTAPPDALRERTIRDRMPDPPLVLSAAARAVVADAIRRCSEQRGWSLLAINVRTNHVHVVVAGPIDAPESAMRLFKAWSTSTLREHGLVRQRRRVWTRHGSTRYLWDVVDVTAAIRYVRDLQ